jgi:hypothetical protein
MSNSGAKRLKYIFCVAGTKCGHCSLQQSLVTSHRADLQGGCIRVKFHSDLSFTTVIEETLYHNVKGT